MIYGFIYLKIVLALLAKVIVFYIQVFIIEFGFLALSSSLWDIGFASSQSYSQLQTNNSRTNLVAFCRFISIYISSRPRVEAKVGEIVGIKMKILLHLIETFQQTHFCQQEQSCGKFIIQSSNQLDKIISKINYKTLIFFLYKLANLLGLKYLEL